MSFNLIEKLAFRLYDLSWGYALPLLRRNHRLAEGFRQRTLSNSMSAASIWIQAASVGEAYLALEIIAGLKTTHSLKILVTSNTKQGIEILERNLSDQKSKYERNQLQVRYFPFDKPAFMQSAVADIQPKVMVLMETEIWPGLLRALKDNHCTVIIVNGRITEKSLKRYLIWPSLWQKIRPDEVLAISREDAQRFHRLFGDGNIDVMSNIKFDRIVTGTSWGDDTEKLKTILPADNPFVVLASVRQEEESLVNNIVQNLRHARPEAVIGLFPRHVHRITAWQKRLAENGIGHSLRSNIDRRIRKDHVILWDTFGELQTAYGLAQAAFVGGSLAPLGGQNFLEALITGIVPIIGPSWDNFAWVGSEIIDSDLVKVADNWKQVAQFLIEDLANPSPRKEVIDAAHQFIRLRRGGTEKACQRILACLEKRT